MSNSSDWRKWVRDRVGNSRKLSSMGKEGIVRFFERAFENTRCVEKAWFGVHKNSIGLVVGNIYLAGIVFSKNDHGIWLMVDGDPPAIEGIDYRPVKSSRSSVPPLIWAHSSDIEKTVVLAENQDIWKCFQQATMRVVDTCSSAGDRDSVNRQRGKRRLSELRELDDTSTSDEVYPDEVDESILYKEGAVKKVIVNAYERNRQARLKCIQKYGTQCYICGFDFKKIYGDEVQASIHVHHETQLSTIGKEYTLDPIEHLKPVCPNCHAVIHSRNPAYSVEEVKEMLKG